MNAAACRMRGSVPYDQESELFTWPSAQLFLMHEKEQALLVERGAFTLLLARHSRSAQLVVVWASVGDVRWPVGKDCLVTAPPATHPASACSLFFGLHLPASHDQLTYQLLLLDYDQSAPSSHVLQISRLQALLALYATFRLQQQPLSDSGPANRNPLKELEEAAGDYWAARIDDKKVEGEKQDAAGAFGKEAEMKEFELIDSRNSHGSSSTTISPAGVSKRMMKRMQKARRISAISKLFSKAVVRGLINAKAHIVHEADYESRNDKQSSTALADNMEGIIDIKPAVANVDAITKVVEAVEEGLPQRMKRSTGNVALAYSGCETMLDISALATWTINELGLRLVLNAAMAINKSIQVASMGAPANLCNSASSSCLTSFKRNSGMTLRADSTGKAVGTTARRAGSSSSSSHFSSLHSTSPTSPTTSPSPRRPPRPPRRADFVLNEVSSSVPVNSNSQS